MKNYDSTRAINFEVNLCSGARYQVNLIIPTKNGGSQRAQVYVSCASEMENSLNRIFADLIEDQKVEINTLRAKLEGAQDAARHNARQAEDYRKSAAQLESDLAKSRTEVDTLRKDNNSFHYAWNHPDGLLASLKKLRLEVRDLTIANKKIGSDNIYLRTGLRNASASLAFLSTLKDRIKKIFESPLRNRALRLLLEEWDKLRDHRDDLTRGSDTWCACGTNCKTIDGTTHWCDNASCPHYNKIHDNHSH